MSQTWRSDIPPEDARISLAGYALAIVRGLPLAIVVFGGLGVHLFVRAIEYPIHGLNRPWTPWIAQIVCRVALRLLGLPLTRSGDVMAHPGALVANHTTWLDIFVLNASKRAYFVSKSEVAGWPGIGWLARATGTLFIDRDPRQARAQAELVQARLKAGHKLLFFPEGTSTDGLRVLPFRSTLFAAFFAEDIRDKVWVQPVTVLFSAPPDAEARFYGWWGDMEFGGNLLKILAQRPQGSVRVVYHNPIRVADLADRKSLARAAEDAVRKAMTAERTGA